MRILGIDPGLIITGYGCIDLVDGGSETKLVEAGVLRLGSKKSLAIRLEQLFTDLNEVLAELSPDRMAVEKLFSHYRHVRTSILMGHARGVLMLAGRIRNIELEEVAATEVKKAVTGRGHASKHQVQHAVMAQCRLRELPQPPDVADAIAIALCAARRVSASTLIAQG